jgi:hypothetical protein
MRSTWRATLTQHALGDILTGHSQFKKIEDLLIKTDDFLITFRNADDTDENFGRPNAFRRKMETIIKANTLFRVAIKLQSADVTSLGLRPRESFSPGSRFTPATPIPTLDQAPGQPLPAPSPNSPPPAPTKLTIESTLDQKNFNTKTVPALLKSSDIHRWYNVLHARGKLCGIYTTPWDAFTKVSYMGATWSTACLDQVVLDRQDSLSTALHGLLLAHEMYQGECKKFSHLIMSSLGNGYLAFYQIVRLSPPPSLDKSQRRENSHITARLSRSSNTSLVTWTTSSLRLVQAGTTLSTRGFF